MENIQRIWSRKYLKHNNVIMDLNSKYFALKFTITLQNFQNLKDFHLSDSYGLEPVKNIRFCFEKRNSTMSEFVTFEFEEDVNEKEILSVIKLSDLYINRVEDKPEFKIDYLINSNHGPAPIFNIKYNTIEYFEISPEEEGSINNFDFSSITSIYDLEKQYPIRTEDDYFHYQKVGDSYVWEASNLKFRGSLSLSTDGLSDFDKTKIDGVEIQIRGLSVRDENYVPIEKSSVYYSFGVLVNSDRDQRPLLPINWSGSDITTKLDGFIDDKFVLRDVYGIYFKIGYVNFYDIEYIKLSLLPKQNTGKKIRINLNDSLSAPFELFGLRLADMSDTVKRDIGDGAVKAKSLTFARKVDSYSVSSANTVIDANLFYGKEIAPAGRFIELWFTAISNDVEYRLKEAILDGIHHGNPIDEFKLAIGLNGNQRLEILDFNDAGRLKNVLATIPVDSLPFSDTDVGKRVVRINYLRRGYVSPTVYVEDNKIHYRDINQDELLTLSNAQFIDGDIENTTPPPIIDAENVREDVSEVLAVSDYISVEISPKSFIREVLIASSTATSRLIAKENIYESTRVSDFLKGIRSDVIDDRLTVSDFGIGRRKLFSRIDDTILISDGPLGRTIIPLLVMESVKISDGLKDKLTAKDVTVEENVAVDFIGSGDIGEGQTWTANSTSWAMSRYAPFRFGRLSVVDGKLYAEAEDGLYILESGKEVIDATLVTGNTDFGGHLTHPANAYFEYATDGTAEMDVITTQSGDKSVYTYRLPKETAGYLTNGRFTFGRGLRGRHFGFAIRLSGTFFNIEDMGINAIDTRRRV